MRTDAFDYALPEERIAQRPAPRGAARLLVLDAAGERRHRRVGDLPELLRPGDLLVVNDTRVIPARLFARRVPDGGRVELLLVERVAADEWRCLARPGRKARVGQRLALSPRRAAGPPAGHARGEGSGDDELPGAEVVAREPEGIARVRFDSPVEPWLERIGHVPLPPYIRRADREEDRDAYQTVYARHPGAVAAPTAGLHLDGSLLDRLEERGVERAAVTLHVGIGTFRPVTAGRVEDHRMERERYRVPEETAEALRRARRSGRRVVAVGTTVVRTLEGVAAAHGGEVPAGGGATDLFITPGFDFRVVDVLLTNFHLPRSTLLMLVSAFAGRERVLAAYAEAVERGYRFYSYGDAMLMERG